MSEVRLGVAGRVAHYFINSKSTPLVIVLAVLLGAFAVFQTPREEEPQIVVPMMDVFVAMPGATAKEVEERVTTPMEKLLWEIPGVEYIYSTTRPGLSMAIVRFKVGEKEEDSIVKLYNKLYSHFDLIPPGASKPLIKPRSIDDVPILALTLWSDRYDSYTLRRIAAELERDIKSIDDVSLTQIIGGQRRQIRVLLDPAKMAARGVAPALIVPAVERANQRLAAGALVAANQEQAVETGDFLRDAEDVGRVVVGVHSGRPVYLRDVAEIRDGPAESADYVLFGFGCGAREEERSSIGEFPAVTLTVAKRKGKNAVVVVQQVLEKIGKVKGTVIPSDVQDSIILVDFIELRRRQGMPLEEAVVDAGAVRFRPMLLTAAAVVVGAFVILFDPIFQGLAISLMAGEVASTLLSRMVVPVLYYLHARHEEGKPADVPVAA